MKIFLLLFFLLAGSVGAAQAASAPITDLGAFPVTNGTNCSSTGAGDTSPCYDVRSYSGPVWDSTNNQLLWWGGGHAATVRDSVFKMSSLGVWTEMYNSTTCAEATIGNLNETNQTWTAGASGPYPRPVARHAYDLAVWASNVQRMVIVGGGNAQIMPCVGGNDSNYAKPGKISHFNPTATTWTITGATGFGGGVEGPSINGSSVSSSHAAAYDPVSGLILIVAGGIWTYNPVTQAAAVEQVASGFFNGQNESGGSVTWDIGDAPELVYTSDDDNFWLLDRTHHLVWRITPPSPSRTSSTSWSSVRPVRKNAPTAGSFPVLQFNDEPGFDYDPVSGRICGALSNNILSCYTRSTNRWDAITMTGGPSNLTSEMHGVRYDTANNRFLIAGITSNGGAVRFYSVTGVNINAALGGGGGDVTNPVATITAPTSASTYATSTSTVDVSGTGTDNVGVTTMTWTNDRGGSGSATCNTCPGTSVTWSISGITLQSGVNVIAVTARDAANNSNTDTLTVTYTPSGTTPEQDFANRCAAAGVILCYGFDTIADLGTKGFGNWLGFDTVDGVACGGLSGGTVANCPIIDTVVKASGAGSMKFVVPDGGDGTRGGQWWSNLSQNLLTQFGANQTVYIQLRERFTQQAIDSGEFKAHWVITAGDQPGCTASSTTNCKTSCEANELVAQTSNNTWKYPTWYSGCPFAPQVPMYEPFGGTDFKMQNARPSPFCLYQASNGGTQFPPTGNCFGYFADEWMTFSYKVQVGARGTNATYTDCNQNANTQNCYYNNDFQARMGREGQPTEAVLTWNAPMNAGDVSENLKYGKLYVSPRTFPAIMQNGSAFWIDEIIVSTQPIADPGGTVPTPNVPIAPSGFKIK